MPVQRPLVVVGLTALSVAALAVSAPSLLSADRSSQDPAATTSTRWVHPGVAGASDDDDHGARAKTGTRSTGRTARHHPSSSAPGRPGGHTHARGTNVPAETDPSTPPPDAAEGPAAAGPLPGLAPPPATPLPLVTTPLPPAGRARGALVAGYPRTALPVAPGSRVTTSSVSPSDGRLQVGLVASIPGGADRVLRFYRVALSGLGLHELPTSGLGGSSAAAFRRGDSSVVVTVTPGRTTTYSVFAVLTSSRA